MHAPTYTFHLLIPRASVEEIHPFPATHASINKPTNTITILSIIPFLFSVPHCQKYLSLIERKILVMGDPLRGNSAESLLGRLDQIDIRLRQLEEKQAVPESYFTADLKASGKPVASAVDEVHLKDTLVNRLNLLETRIRQLSHEVDKGGSTGCGSSDMCSSSNTMLVKQVMKEGGGITYPAEKQKLMKSNCSGRADIFQSHMSEKKVKDPMQAATNEAMEKRTATFCHKEKKRMEHTRLYRRWFPVSC